MSDKITHIGQLKFDKRNPRKHNPRNIGVIVNSLQQVGPARSIVIDEDDSILAGNGVTEAAAIAGIEKVIEVEADGDAIIAVRRRGLTLPVGFPVDGSASLGAETETGFRPIQVSRVTFELSGTNRATHSNAGITPTLWAINWTVLLRVKTFTTSFAGKVASGSFSSVNLKMAIFTKRLTIGDIISQFRVIGPRFYVVSLHLLAPLLAHLAGVVILLKNLDSPFLVFIPGYTLASLFVAFVFGMGLSFLKVRSVVPVWGFGSALNSLHDLVSYLLSFPCPSGILAVQKLFILRGVATPLGTESALAFFNIPLPCIEGILAILADLLDYTRSKLSWFWHVTSKIKLPRRLGAVVEAATQKAFGGASRIIANIWLNKKRALLGITASTLIL